MSLLRVRVSGTTAAQTGSRSVPPEGDSEIGDVSTGPDTATGVGGSSVLMTADSSSR